MAQLPSLLEPNLTPNPNYMYVYKPTRFFADQLAAFEIAIQSGAEAFSSGVDGTGSGTGAGGQENPAPEQLPTLLLCLSQTTYRVRALLLLCKYLDTGADAVFSALYCGVTPLITKLIGSTEMLLMLIVVWLQVVRVDPTFGCNELAKAKAEVNFLRFLQLKSSRFRLIQDDAEASSAHQATVAAGGKPTASPTSQVSPTSAVSPTTNASANAAPSSEFPTIPPAATASADPLPAFCAVEGVTIDRCKAISCYLLCRMMQEQRYQINRQVAAKQRQSLFHNAPNNPNAPHHPRSGSHPPGYVPDPNAAAAAAEANFNNAVALVAAQPQPTVAISIWNTLGFTTGRQLIGSKDAHLRSWGCLFLATLFDAFNTAKEHAAIEFARSTGLFYPLLGDSSPVVRASCVTLLGSLLGCRIDEVHCETADDQDRRIEVDKSIVQLLVANLKDPSRNVRTEIAVAAAQCIFHYYAVVRQAREAQLLDNVATNPSNPPYFAPPHDPVDKKRGSSFLQSVPSNERLSSSQHTPFKGRAAPHSQSNTGHSSQRPTLAAATSSRHLGSPSHSPRGQSPRHETPQRGSSPQPDHQSSSQSPFLTLSEVDGFRGKAFRLEGRNAGVMSLLSSLQPSVPSSATDYSKSDGGNSSNTTGYATKDSPPITTPWTLTKLKKHHLLVMEELVHDSILILHILRHGCDTAVSRIVEGVVSLLAAGIRPMSERVASEANVSMQGLSTASTSLTEADRVRERRKADMMRQVVLDLPIGKELAPINTLQQGISSPQAGGSTGGGGQFPKVSSVSNIVDNSSSSSLVVPNSPTAPANPSLAGLEALAAADAAHKPYYSIQHALPIPNHHPIVAAQFRAVEKQMVIVESNNRISLVSYEGEQGTTLLESFVHSSPFYQSPSTDDGYDVVQQVAPGALYGVPGPSAVLQKCLLVNDLSDSPMLLTVDGAGVFSLYNGLLTGNPTIVSAFQAERGHGDSDPTSTELVSLLTGHNRRMPTSGGISSVPFPNLQCAYRSHDATLFYGSGVDGIYLLSVAEERRLQHLATPGDGLLTSLAVQGHGGTAVFAGFSDGVVRYFDDRVRSGRSSLILTMEAAAVGSRTIHDGIIGVGVSGENIVFACTHKKLKLFDIRYYREPRKTIDLIPPSFSKPTNNLVGSVSMDASVTARHTISAFDMCSHYPLSVTMSNEGFFDFHNGNGESLILNPCMSAAGAVNVAGTAGMYDGTKQTIYGSAPASHVAPTSSFGGPPNDADHYGGNPEGSGTMFTHSSFLGRDGNGSALSGFLHHADPEGSSPQHSPLTPSASAAVSALFGNANPSQFHGLMQTHSQPVVGNPRVVVASGSGAKPLRLKSSIVRSEAPVVSMHPMRSLAFAAGEIVTLL